MQTRFHRPPVTVSCAWAFVTLASCSDPFHFDAASTQQAIAESCAASADWLPLTPAVELFDPLPHPAAECSFYRAGWQNFLVATQPDAGGLPALRGYPTIDQLFVSAKPRAASRAWLGDLKQAGGRQILVDQNGRPIYYGIHVNQAYADFIHANHLESAQALRDADPTLFFPAGVVELKSAWQEVDPSDPSLASYITVKTTVPHLTQTAGHIVEDRNNPRPITARLLALHVVFTLPGHPEFIWATFEHSTGTPDTKAADGKRDVAPASAANPSSTDPNNQQDDSVVSADPHLLFKGGTTANAGNQAIAETDLRLDQATQSFPGQQTSIYRMFPASKSNTVDPDDAITSLNHNVEALFAQAEVQGTLGAADKRGHYRLVGALWMDKPENFALNKPIQNDESSPFAGQPGFLQDIEKNGTDSAFSVLAGEDRLSSTAMESFTQAPDSFPNCFSCHNTQAITAKGVSFDRDQNGVKLLEPKLLNVSHVLAQFLLDEAQ